MIAAGEDARADDVNALVPVGGIIAWLKTFAQRSTGTATTDTANKLVDTGADFVSDGVAVGDIVENETDGTFGYVTAVDSATSLSLNSDVFPDGNEDYKVWKTPKLSDLYVECNGQSISDAGSVYNGVTAPNLNASGGGSQRFLRGSTRSGDTGGEDTHTLTESEMPAHTHTLNFNSTDAGGGIGYSTQSATPTAEPTSSTGGGNAHENRPPYYEIVWVMRIK